MVVIAVAFVAVGDVFVPIDIAIVVIIVIIAVVTAVVTSVDDGILVDTSRSKKIGPLPMKNSPYVISQVPTTQLAKKDEF